ncbi:MAG: hypothetical protein A2Z25_15280 [Planctomycetes bacterium RBG_16_55_9]|nr:MAG: hypothetical protein A2Z25_15280 [Planctomycetes bacterium RBG_16_55_9]
MTNSIGMKLVWISPGEFMMGSPPSEKYRDSSDDEGPQHQVHISRGFWMGQTEVTQHQYETVMGTSPWSGRTYVQQSGGNPAVYVSWNDAVEFCKKLSTKEGKTYRLPTEAEWEYACRAGTTTPYSFDESEFLLSDYAWIEANALSVGENYAHPVGQKKSNAWGLFDMHGNVWEWCSDWYGTYSQGSATDPQGPSSGSSRVLRGGSWFYDAGYCRSAYRDGNSPGDRSSSFGFRVALDF